MSRRSAARASATLSSLSDDRFRFCRLSGDFRARHPPDPGLPHRPARPKARPSATKLSGGDEPLPAEPEQLRASLVLGVRGRGRSHTSSRRWRKTRHIVEPPVPFRRACLGLGPARAGLDLDPRLLRGGPPSRRDLRREPPEHSTWRFIRYVPWGFGAGPDKRVSHAASSAGREVVRISLTPCDPFPMERSVSGEAP